MSIKVLKVNESIKEEVYKMGFIQWKNTSTWEEYWAENKEEDKIGIRFALSYLNEIVASIYVREFTPINGMRIIGLGSLITIPSQRSKGFAEILMKEVISECKSDFSNSIFMGYSDIHPNYYERKFGFKILPIHLQKYQDKPCIVKSNETQWKEILQTWKRENLPDYF